MNQSIISGFLRSCRTHSGRPAVEVQGERLSYDALHNRGRSIAATLNHFNPAPAVPLTAIFAHRSPIAYAGVVGTLLRGHGYVPLNWTFPIERTQMMLQSSGCDELVVDAESAQQLTELLDGIPTPLLVVGPAQNDWGQAKRTFPQHRFVSSHELLGGAAWLEPTVSEEALAYLLFTSGSTGIPKGVMVTHGNVHHYVEYISHRYSITESDRFSQIFAMTSDLSAADMFVAWSNGACVCCPDPYSVILPGRFINESRLTIWFSVPSTAIFMRRLGMLKPGAYPRLRVSMFCGEALPMEIAHDWQQAAKNSVVDNLYGPTELTIACTACRWQPNRTSSESELGCVPIGDPFPDMKVLITDEKLQAVPDGVDGELLMAGPQKARGYWRDPELTNKAFVTPPGKVDRYYRTGDRVRRNPGKPLVYLDRMDNQVKILGHRVELGEIEAVARQVCCVPAVVAIAWPTTPTGASGIELFVECEDLDQEVVLVRMAKRLPTYMVPRGIHLLPKLPLNLNGKYDRLELKRRLGSRSD